MNDSNSKAPQVNVESGRLSGLYEDGIAVFRGVPFAAPPVGNLRWKPPQPVEPWDGVRPAVAFGPISMQSIAEGSNTYFETLVKGHGADIDIEKMVADAVLEVALLAVVAVDSLDVADFGRRVVNDDVPPAVQ